ncbi:hypothetical protein RN001_013671 [Aquatica leii]|uniref:Uncharacterized protein n=1 Tax=Aquatica leii TaxID=1421715 RepID=A0AAN7P4R5_9COLE|nr:hypothetical protein RN001_013671 [Aquatica leii]
MQFQMIHVKRVDKLDLKLVTSTECAARLVDRAEEVADTSQLAEIDINVQHQMEVNRLKQDELINELFIRGAPYGDTVAGNRTKLREAINKPVREDIHLPPDDKLRTCSLKLADLQEDIITMSKLRYEINRLGKDELRYLLTCKGSSPTEELSVDELRAKLRALRAMERQMGEAIAEIKYPYSYADDVLALERVIDELTNLLPVATPASKDGVLRGLTLTLADARVNLGKINVINILSESHHTA